MLAFSARSFAPFAFSPIAFAIQGLIEELQKKTIFQDTDQGKAGRNQPQRDYLSENLRRQHEARTKASEKPEANYNLTCLHEDDALATDLIVALVTKGFFDG